LSNIEILLRIEPTATAKKLSVMSALLRLLALCLACVAATRKVAAGSSAKQQYLNTMKGLYVWNPGKTEGTQWWGWSDNGNTPRLVSFCNAHNFKRAIVFVGTVEWDWADNFKTHQLPHEAHFVTLFRALRTAGIKPTAAFYLNDDPNSMVGVDKTMDVVHTIAAFNLAHPDAVIAGLEGDQEPNRVDGEYERMGKIMRPTRDDLDIHLEIGAGLRPKWLNQAPDFHDALDSLDSGMLMAYSSQKSVSRTMARRALVHANDVGKSLSIAIEVANMPDLADDTFYNMVNMLDKDPFFAMVAEMNATYSADEFYVDMVIHAYHHYFDVLFGVHPDAFGSDNVDGRLYAGDSTPTPSSSPTSAPTTAPTHAPTAAPFPTSAPTTSPAAAPAAAPSDSPCAVYTVMCSFLKARVCSKRKGRFVRL
jgi:hypothetical protein